MNRAQRRQLDRESRSRKFVRMDEAAKVWVTERVERAKQTGEKVDINPQVFLEEYYNGKS